MNRTIQARLSAMMFLEFFVWGAWYTTVAVFMSANGLEDLTHWPFTVNPIAALVAPFFVGLIADRYFATQRVLGALHLLGAVFMLAAPSVVGYPLVFILLLLAYNLCYMPTMSLANTLAFHNMTDQESQFPVIRVFGTVGWIAAGLLVSYVGVYFVGQGTQPEATAFPLYLTAGVSALYGLYSFTLPHTPPPAKGEEVSIRSIVGIDALKKLGSPSFYVFLLSSFLISIPLAAYYNFTQVFLDNAGFQDVAAVQTIGQMSEVLFMLLMPLFFVRLGVKWMLGVGMLAWVVRYALFAMGAPDVVTWMVIGGIALHGICYDFFFVTGQIYVDKKASDEVRGQAQGLIVLITYGAGMLIGAQAAGGLFNYFLGDAGQLTLSQWYNFWWVPALFAGAVFVFFVLFFRDEVKVSEESVASVMGAETEEEEEAAV
ncbi:MAG: MFS transporter [Bacteroidetes bacterium QH_10_64_37]|jgi:nucleoside transporter|nr:MAG: MFS transporter [Bacteroidetes bacterium QH_10_64_37]